MWSEGLNARYIESTTSMETFILSYGAAQLTQRVQYECDYATMSPCLLQLCFIGHHLPVRC